MAGKLTTESTFVAKTVPEGFCNVEFRRLGGRNSDHVTSAVAARYAITDYQTDYGGFPNSFRFYGQRGDFAPTILQLPTEQLPMLAVSSSLEAGKRLRAVRERLGLTTRDVEQLSDQIAAEKNDQAFSLSHNWLSEVENGKFRPRLPKLYALCLIYKCNINEMLGLFGLNVLDLPKERGIVALPNTHLVPAVLPQLESFALPVPQLPPSQLPAKFGLEQTNLLPRIFENLGEMPLFLLQHGVRRDLLYGYIGTKDYTLEPVIHAGSLVQIDPRQTKVIKRMWASEHERPVYFLELHDNRYACSWCELDGDRLLLVPSPLSPAQTRQLRYPHDAEIVGRVTGVAMQIAAFDPDDLNEASPNRISA